MRPIFITMCLAFSAMLLVSQPAYAGGGGAKPKAEKKAEGGHGGEKKAEGGHGGGDKKKGKEKSPIEITEGPSDTYYMKLDPMIMPVLGKDNALETVSMIVALQIAKQKDISEISHLVPKIKDAYLSALYGNLNKASYRNGQFLDITKVRNKLIAVTTGFADKNVIQDVLIQGVSQRRFN